MSQQKFIKNFAQDYKEAKVYALTKNRILLFGELYKVFDRYDVEIVGKLFLLYFKY